MSAALAINLILDVGIVLAILSVLGWGIRSQAGGLAEPARDRRSGVDRRRVQRPVARSADRRRVQRRVTLTA